MTHKLARTYNKSVRLLSPSNAPLAIIVIGLMLKSLQQRKHTCALITTSHNTWRTHTTSIQLCQLTKVLERPAANSRDVVAPHVSVSTLISHDRLTTHHKVRHNAYTVSKLDSPANAFDEIDVMALLYKVLCVQCIDTLSLSVSQRTLACSHTDAASSQDPQMHCLLCL